MATFTKLKSGSWRVQIRRKGRYVSETFVRREDARRWALDAERQIDRGQTPANSRIGRLKTFGELIDLHVADMKEVGKPPGRSKQATLDMLRRELGKLGMGDLDRERLVRFGRKRAAQGAGPVTLSMDVGAIKLVVAHAAAVHGLPVILEPIDLARVALNVSDMKGPRPRLGRRRRPSPLPSNRRGPRTRVSGQASRPSPSWRAPASAAAQSFAARSRRALAITLTEDSAIAAAAIRGESRRWNVG